MWVRDVGIPDNVRTEFAIMELARLVGDPEEVHLPSLQWRSIRSKFLARTLIKLGEH